MIHNILGAPSRDLSRLTLNAAPTAVALSTLTGHLAHINPAFHTLFALPSQGMIDGLNITDLCCDDAAAALSESVARDGRTRRGELEMHCGSRGRRRLLCMTSRVDDDQGTPVWLAWVCFELQSQHLVDQRRLQDLHCLLDAQQLSGAGSWQIRVDTDDLKTNPMLWSPALSQLLGQPPQITERPVAGFLQYLHPEDRSAWLEMLQQAATSTDDCQLTYRLLLRDGMTIPMRSRSKCASRQPGRSPTLIGTEQDLSELNELRQTLQRTTVLLNAAADTKDEPLYAVDRSLRYICFNAAYRETMLRGHGQEPQLGDRISPGAPDLKHYRRIHHHLRRALAGQQVVHSASDDDIAAEHADRDVVYQPLLNDSGEITGVMVSQTAARPPSSQRAPRPWQD